MRPAFFIRESLVESTWIDQILYSRPDPIVCISKHLFFLGSRPDPILLVGSRPDPILLDKDTPHIEQIKTLLSTDDEHDLIIIEGDLHGKSWTIGINLIILAEQFYEYAEIACENCGA